MRLRLRRAAAASSPSNSARVALMAALIYIIQSLLTLALFVVLARLFLQWARADFRNPICQAIVRLTNPVIVPLRRILPPIRKVDTASVVAVILVAIVEIVIITSLAGF